MNTLFLRRIFLSSLLAAALSAGAFAQEPPPDEFGSAPKPADVRANALQQLGLSREQLMEIRRINQARRPQMQQAQDRLRQAGRALDAAVYSDSVSNDAFQARLRDFQAAQAEVARIRFAGELAIRRVLNPQQVARFRQIRERFDQAREGGLPPPRRMSKPPKFRRVVPVSNK